MGKKKANGEGSITKRKDGRYMGRYAVESKQKAVYGDFFEEVRQKLNEILNEIAKGAYVEPNKFMVASSLSSFRLISWSSSLYSLPEEVSYSAGSMLPYQNSSKIFITSPSTKSVCDVNSGGGKLQVGDLPELQLSFLSFLSHGYHYKTVHIRDYSQPWTVLCI